ncbi:4-aminobutyrate aminotransferase / (S)-3-amino-2-methylpropionate transaminase [Collimonas sp. OK307]|uniref:4-aminobutyrate--2-oxoglutarate transaminase n=1 Tax=Collimonas sp. OK307 TaxID=1801620 RepID=UPI0008EE0054|nr:4-aminobutyrate--2-oxoglutarate transaminase [Collimonas sp. OK307]SFH71959.1 4-aminobutyrate aminotransferase / (S)-3-amino-2-methylpropionate transaminase [Collimonas sp. OK307]
MTIQANNAATWQQRRQTHIARGVLTAHPLLLTRGQGAHVWDQDGRQYIDFVGGIGVLNVGHNHPRVVDAAAEQLDKLSHTCFQVAAYEPYIALAERLNALVGDGQAYKTAFLTTGAEATENAIKIARAYTNRPGVIAFRGGFHGRTLLGMSLTGMSQPYKQNFGPFAPDVYHTAFPDAYRGISTARALESLQEIFATAVAPDRVAAILIEPVQGDGGFLPVPNDFLVELRRIATEHGIVLIADEIQTGFGRTGKMFGFQHSGIEPDLVTVAKSLAGGLPLSAVVGKAHIMDAPAPGGLGGTYAGNPVACAAALAVLDVIEEEHLLERSIAIGEQLANGFGALQRKYAVIGEVRGLGAMRAIEFVKNADSKEHDAALAQRVIDHLREHGLLAIKCGVHRNVVRALVPLVADAATIEAAVKIFDVAIGEAIAA